MSIWNWLSGKKQAPVTRAISYQNGVAVNLVEPPSRTGVHVNEITALGVSAVWCAVNVISSQIGTLPLVLYKRNPVGGGDRADEHPLYELLATEPNRETSRPVFWETFISHALLFGNGFAEIERDGSGQPLALWNIDPRAVQIGRDGSGELVYSVTTSNGTVHLQASDILHVPGLTADGTVGHNLLKVARDNISFSISADRYGQAFFGNGARAGGKVIIPDTFSDAARENIKKSFNSAYQGVDAAGRTVFLESGLQYEQFNSTSNEAGQYDETRRFQIAEVSRLFDISPVKLHELGRATWGNLEALNTDFWSTSCQKWAEKVECELERKCLSKDERKQYYVEFQADVLLRGDITTRYAAYKVARDGGWLSVDEIRALENLPPLPEPDPTPTPVPPIGQLPDDQGALPDGVTETTSNPEGTNGNS